MIWQYKSYDAIRAIKSAQQALTEALTHAQKPHLFGSALFDTNQAMRRLAEAQWRLMQAKEEYNRKKNGLDKS